MRGKIWICHTGENLNNSDFKKEVIEKAIPSLANIPVLGFIQANASNENDFAGHEQRIVIDKDGAHIEYLGRMYGIVPESNNAQFENKVCEDGIEREFLTAEVLLHTKFPECIDIVQRDGIKGHSMELHPDSIQGKFNNKGVFEFTEFKFEGLCLLGDGVTPAMTGSVIELFSRFNYNSQLIEMLSEFNANYAATTMSNNQDTKEGGETLNEKLELFSKYPTLTEADIADLKANSDQYTIEELDTKLKDLFEKTNDNIETEPTKFTLTALQLEQVIRAELNKEKYVDSWGDNRRNYWYLDHDEARVYAEDVQNSYLPVGISYALSGDTVILDLSTKKRIKWVPQDLEDGSEVVSTLMSAERGASDVEKVTEQFEAYKSETTETIQQLETKYSSKETEYSVLSNEHETVKNQLTEVQTNYSNLVKSENDKKLDLLFAEFSKELSEDELAEIKSQKDALSYSDIEIKLFALVGKKKANFSTGNIQTKHIDFSIEKQKHSTGKSYDELFEKYSV